MVCGDSPYGKSKDGSEGQESGGDDAAINDGGHKAQAERCGLGREDGLEEGFGGLDYGGDGMGSEQNGRPLGRCGFHGRSGRDLGSFDLKDAELGGFSGVIGLFAQRALGQARTGLAGGHKLAGKLDQVGGDVDGRVDVFEGGRLAEGDLFIEGKTFGFVERTLRAESGLRS